VRRPSGAEEYANAKGAGFEQLVPKPVTLKSLHALLLSRLPQLEVLEVEENMRSSS
jgi:hypothetical protein